MEQTLRPIDHFTVKGDYRVLEMSSSVQSLPGYHALIAEIDGLLADEDYDNDYQRPTPDAIERSKAFLTETQQQVPAQFPVADAVPDGVGGIRLYWARKGRNVQLNIPADRGTELSLFWRDGTQHALDRGALPSELARRLTWFSVR